MYRFQIRANTQAGESIGLVGSIPELGQWDITRSLRLRTSGDRYPLWWADVDLKGTSDPTINYKYVHIGVDGNAAWEAWGLNRWVPVEPSSPSNPIIVDDGAFGYLQPWPFGYLEQPAKVAYSPSTQGLKVVVAGSSVALGCNAWLLKGWAWQLGQVLNQTYGHQLVNVSALGANVHMTLDQFDRVVAPEQPDIVIIALSLGNEGLAYCPPYERRAVQRRFESGLQQLVKQIRDLGAQPILGSVYPNGDYSPEHYWLLQDTHQRMLTWDVPVLDWLSALDDGHGRWKSGLSFDPAHPNTEGHRLMFESIDLSLFQIDKAQLLQAKQQPRAVEEVAIYLNPEGLHVSVCRDEQRLRIKNPSTQPLTLSPAWAELQVALQRKAGLIPGLYIAQQTDAKTPSVLTVGVDGTLETTIEIPPTVDLDYRAAVEFFAPSRSQILYYDGNLGILKETDHSLRIINESDHDYNIQPMWKEVSAALNAMPPGVYTDPSSPDSPFRTLMIGNNGLESRVKAPPKSAMVLEYQCQLSDIERVAILSLGDRCALRMLLYKMEYDGPAFPFDLTRTTNPADVADIVARGFQDMWNPDWLQHYNSDEKRLYHGKWLGLSFGHEVEETDDPLTDMGPVYERMRVRYSARAERFCYTVEQADKVLFVRTAYVTRRNVEDLLEKLADQRQGKPFCLLIFSEQPTEDFAGLTHVLHYNMEFNPDRMYADSSYWMDCTAKMRGILADLGVSSKNLFWCPPNPPKA